MGESGPVRFFDTEFTARPSSCRTLLQISCLRIFSIIIECSRDTGTRILGGLNLPITIGLHSSASIVGGLLKLIIRDCQLSDVMVVYQRFDAASDFIVSLLSVATSIKYFWSIS